MVVVLYCLENNDKKVHIYSVQIHFLKNIFDLQLVEPLDTEGQF
jgi:hypothetical protein